MNERKQICVPIFIGKWCVYTKKCLYKAATCWTGTVIAHVFLGGVSVV